MKDTILKNSIKEIKLDKPSDNFTIQLMDKIHKIPVPEKVKTKILGLNFWIFILLFVALMVGLSILSSSGIKSDGSLTELLPTLNVDPVGNTYNSILGKVGTLPLSIASILGGITVLLFLERYLSSRKQVAI